MFSLIQIPLKLSVHNFKHFCDRGDFSFEKLAKVFFYLFLLLNLIDAVICAEFRIALLLGNMKALILRTRLSLYRLDSIIK